jgi:hypothetical protein
VFRYRRLPSTVDLDEASANAELDRGEAHEVVEDLEGLLLRKSVQQPNEGQLVGEAESVLRPAALADLRQVALGEGRFALELPS